MELNEIDIKSHWLEHIEVDIKSQRLRYKVTTTLALLVTLVNDTIKIVATL